jgi:alkylation response protein AidB-like acyl-CoA dehydrogenase
MTDLRASEVETSESVEDLESFRQRARAFIRANLREMSPAELRRDYTSGDEEAELALLAREREVQRLLFDAGLAGICVPPEYGGQGLTPEHQHVLNEEITGYEYPSRVQVPTMSPCAAVILEFGTDAQKRAHIPAILKGEALWMQFLSEPSGGSDVAGALTTAVRDGDQWVLNGSKVWTSGAWWSDWGLCLARTNWDVPKHRGLTVFMLPIHQPGIEVHRIEMLNGSREFCQEFITDVVVPDSERVGAVDDGWTVGTRWMFHERMLFNSPYVTHPIGFTHGSLFASSVFDMAQERGVFDDASVREMVGEARMLELAGDALNMRVNERIRAGQLSDQAAALVRLFKGLTSVRINTLTFEVAGPDAAAWDEGANAGSSATNFIMRQAGTIGGGTVEMARNVISERVLGMPRERALDRDIPFRDVPRSRSSQTGSSPK